MKLDSNQTELSRKEFLTGMGVIAATAAIPGMLSAEEHDHHHHHHTKRNNPAVVDAAISCVATGEACVDHCIDLIKNNDTSIIQCLDTANEMLAVCRGLITLAAADSKLLKKYAKVCIEACEACEKECRKHADKHDQCKACAESCAECIKACKAI